MAIWKTKWGWRAEFEFRGERIIAKGFFKYKEEAREWVKNKKKTLKELLGRSSSLGRRDITFWFLAQRYLAYSEANHDAKTFKEKKFCLERFYREIGDIDVTDVTPPMALEFLNQRAQGQSNNAANKDRKNIKAFYRWVQEMYGIMHDPTGPIKKKPHTRKARRLIPIQDIFKIMMAAEGHDRVIVAVFWHTGARRGEVFRLTWADDINFEQRWVRLGTKKSRTGEMVYEKLWMNDDLYEHLMWQWKRRHLTSPYVFCEMNPKKKRYAMPYAERKKFIKRLCRKAGAQQFDYHDIRHTVAKYLNDLQKVGLKKVQQVMRHQRQSTTEIYVEGHYTDTRDVMTLLEFDNVKEIVSESPQKSPQKLKKTQDKSS